MKILKRGIVERTATVHQKVWKAHNNLAKLKKIDQAILDLK